MNLKSLFKKVAEHPARVINHVNPDNTALVVIDVQEEFCAKGDRTRGTGETERIAKKISRLIPAFRKAGYKVYVVHTLDHPVSPVGKPGFHKFKPDTEDTMLAKKTTSAFDSTKIKSILRTDGKENLLVCGFNLSACVYTTAVHAVQSGFHVTLIKDLAGNDNKNPQDLRQERYDYTHKGISMEWSADLLRQNAPKL